jgi:1-acyl-sn-glycerol-3-phosphate acyltransferase
MNDYPEITPNFIDLKKPFVAKNPRLARLIPDFVYTFLKRIIHIDKINLLIYNHRDKFGLPFVRAILNEFDVKPEVAPPGWKFPDSGRFIIASNHPLGGMDGLVLLDVVGSMRPDVVFPVNDILLFLPGLKSLFIPINKHGRNTENLEIIHNMFRSDKTILYFPAGLVSRKQKGGVIRDLEWKKTFITQAKRYQRDVIPVFISGRNSKRFYRIANWRKALGIKANLEMLLLPDELMNTKKTRICVHFGEPVPYTSFDSSKTDREWAEFIKEKVYALGCAANPEKSS